MPSRFAVPREAGPLEVCRLLLAFLESGENVRLSLDANAGLASVDLSRATLGSHAREHDEPPSWWDSKTERPSFPGARLAGVNLRGANLSGVDLHGALLEEAQIGAANLSDGLFEHAQLRGADLASADLRRAQFGQANLRDALLEEANLEEAVFRFADLRGCVLEHARMARADLWGAQLGGADMAGADLRQATLHEAQLKGANLTGADLRGAILEQADFSGARLVRANLEGVTLSAASFRGASLQGARLQELDLTSCDLTHVSLSDAWLDRTRFYREQLGDAIGEELAKEYEAARRGYLALERNFEQQGDSDAASWAYRRKRRMQKWAMLAKARAMQKQRKWRTAAAHLVRFGSDQFVEWLCDYGESIPRVLGALAAVYLLFAVLYGVTGSIVRLAPAHGGAATITRHPMDLAIYSLLAMSTAGDSANGLEARGPIAEFLTGMQALVGIAVTGLLGFVMGNRIRR